MAASTRSREPITRIVARGESPRGKRLPYVGICRGRKYYCSTLPALLATLAMTAGLMPGERIR